MRVAGWPRAVQSKDPLTGRSSRSDDGSVDSSIGGEVRSRVLSQQYVSRQLFSTR